MPAFFHGIKAPLWLVRKKDELWKLQSSPKFLPLE